MKKFKYLIALFLFPTLLFAGSIQQMHQSVLAVSASGGGCAEVFSIGETDDASQNVAGGGAGNNYIAGQFTWTPATNTNLRKIQIKIITDTGDPSSNTYNLSMDTDSGNDPSTQVTNATCTFTGFDSGTAVYHGCVTTSAFTLTNGVSYHVRADRGGSSDSFNDIFMRYDADAGTDDLNASSDGTSWTPQDFDMTITVKVFEGDGCTAD